MTTTLKWEKLECLLDDKPSKILAYRARAAAGWLVATRGDDLGSARMTFVPDPDNTWAAQPKPVTPR